MFDLWHDVNTKLYFLHKIKQIFQQRVSMKQICTTIKHGYKLAS